LSRSKTFEWYSRFKNGRTSIDDDDRFLWDGGSGASRVSSPTPDHELDCLHNRSATPSRCSSSETASQMVFRYLVSAPRQCAMPRGPECQGILGQAQHPRGSPPSLLTRFGPLRLLPLPQAEERPEGEKISRRRGDTTKYDTAVAGHSQTSLPDMHWKVEGSQELLHTIWSRGSQPVCRDALVCPEGPRGVSRNKKNI
jgi:hypothetical protein